MVRQNASVWIVRWSLPVALLLFGGLAAHRPAMADRPAEHRKAADYVMIGNVDAVYVRDAGSYVNYIVELKVEVVEKGTGLKPGDTFRAFCYQRKPGKGGFFDEPGHDAVPKEGQRIKAYISRGNGRHEGVYPNWFDPAPAGKR